MSTKNPSPAQVLLGEVKWLDEALGNANPNDFSDQYLYGFSSCIRWVKFHGDHPHLLEGREYGEEK